MQTLQLVTPSAACASHLVIHASPEVQAAGSRLGRGHPEDLPSPVCIKIEGADGRAVLAIEDPSPLFDVVLPAGQYEVVARQGEVERHYPLSLEAHALRNLHLRLIGWPQAQSHSPS